jgi:hypothetical protein
MNIFFLHPNPTRCARWHCDKHVVKMILETAQLLYTAHWVLAASAGVPPALETAPPRKDQPTTHGYMSIHNPKHPCAIWTRESLQHYQWLVVFGIALCNEYRVRFDNKAHSCEKHLLWLYWNPPAQLKDKGWVQPPKAMPEEYKRSKDSVRCYRLYYKENKGAVRNILTYTHRHPPHWL